MKKFGFWNVAVVVALVCFGTALLPQLSLGEDVVIPPKDVKNLVAKVASFCDRTPTGNHLGVYHFLIVGVDEEFYGSNRTRVFFRAPEGVRYKGHSVKGLVYRLWPTAGPAWLLECEASSAATVFIQVMVLHF